MSKSYVMGVAAAIFATFSWALNFLSPYLMGDYGPVDFITMRFIVSGCIGFVMIYVYWSVDPVLSWRSIFAAGLLGVLGYALYIGCIMGSVLNGGAIIAPAFLSATPVIIAVTGNVLERTVSWSRLCAPIVLAGLGLVATNYGAFIGVLGGDTTSYLLAVGYATGAVLAWLTFSVLNQKAMAKIPQVRSGLWTGLMMSGAGLSVLLFIPFGLVLGVYSYPNPALDIHNTLRVFAAASTLACVASVGGAWAWNFASQRLPMALSGQLISIETIFAASFGLIAEHRLPTSLETLGIVGLLAGAAIAVKVMARDHRASSHVRA